MLSKYSAPRRRTLEQYFRCLSASRFEGVMGNYFIVFEFNRINQWFRKGQITQLLEKWKIQDAEGLKAKVSELLNPEADLYEEYRRFHAALFSLSEAARSRYIEAHKQHEDYAKLTMVEVCLHQLPSGNISGYGVSWAVALCRAGQLKGWFSPEEAWHFKLEAAKMAQSTYGSWSDFFVANAIGSHFDTPKPEIKHYMMMTSMFNLMDQSSLLYKKAVWNTNLEPDRF
ncbi:DUF1266 domain-containing protein [Paenibacillus sp. CAA11]|uniref:DUF1266 domain-containing protein n=1 Tax=Paenibacillus sp. CAA11 TaxID=1532905 RepID=UPI00131F1BEB|nr:DUF1266 domain-containing protein [Paenibacillus sp. CAA11]